MSVLQRARKLGGIIGGTIAAVVTRTVTGQPFVADSPWNLSLGVNTTFDARTDRRSALLNGWSANVNYATPKWTIQVGYATASDPLCDLTTSEQGANPGFFRVPPGFAPDATTGDGWCVVVQPDGSSVNAYRLARTGTTTFTATYYRLGNLRTDYGFDQGACASGVNLYGGLITDRTTARLAAGGRIGHALRVSIPVSVLKKNPGLMDGTVISPATWKPTQSVWRWGYVWPGHGADQSVEYGDPNDGVDFWGIAMGAWLGIPPSVNLEAFGFSVRQRRVAQDMREYGFVVTAATDDVLAIYATPDCDPTIVAEIAEVWAALAPHVVVVQSNSPTGVDYDHMTPTAAQRDTNVLGGVPRLAAAPPAFSEGI